MSKRAFVQLAKLNGEGQLLMGSPVMAFIEPDAPWLHTVNEFVMSCNDDEVEVAQRPKGLLEGCRIVDASTLAQVTSSSSCNDGGHYFLCPNTNALNVLLHKNGMPVPEEAPKDSSNSSEADRARESVHLTSRLESLDELRYYFDEHGTLKHGKTNQAVRELMKDPSKAFEIDEILRAAIFHIQMDMLAEMAFQQAPLPIDPRPDEPKEARSSVFLSTDWRTAEHLLVVINSGRGVQPGIWSRDLLLQEGLELGSMLPTFRAAQRDSFAVAVLNPFTNKVTVDGTTYPIRGNSSPDDHILYVWDEIIMRAHAPQVFVLAHSAGAKLVTTLLQNREASAASRLRAIVFVEAAYSIDPSSTSPLVGQFLRQKAINFKADPYVPVGQRLPEVEKQLSCSCLCVGDLSNASVEALHPTWSSSGKTRSSNVAGTIRLSMDTTFSFFREARDRGMSAGEYIAEVDKKAHSWGHKLRLRIDSLKKPGKKTRRTSSTPGEKRPLKTARSLPESTAMRTSILSRSSSADAKDESSISVSDFDLIKVIGRGMIGKVFLVRKVGTHEVFAMKVLRKKNVRRSGLQEHIRTERLILEEIDHPFIARLRFSFQTKDKLYLVTDYCSGGELFYHMDGQGFAYERARFYAAELVLALEHLHSLKVAYRDLKPENILVEPSGHVRITDFGYSKLDVVADGGAQSIVGSKQYMAPEIFRESYGFAVDWWSLGILILEMLTGCIPYEDENPRTFYMSISNYSNIDRILPTQIPRAAADIVFQLLALDPSKRLGSRGALEVREHAFFEGIDWDRLRKKELDPPWKPDVRDELDVRNFEEQFTDEPAVDSVPTQRGSVMSGGHTFDDFTFNPTISEGSTGRI